MIFFEPVCNCCALCHKETSDPNPFYICDECKERASKNLKVSFRIAGDSLVAEVDDKEVSKPLVEMLLEDLKEDENAELGDTSPPITNEE